MAGGDEKVMTPVNVSGPAKIALPAASAARGMVAAVILAPEMVGGLTKVILGVVPPLEAILPDPVTAVTPPAPVATLTDCAGQVPEIVVFVPATSEGLAVAVPPLAIGSGLVIVMLGVVPPEDANGLEAVTEVTPMLVTFTAWLGHVPETVVSVPATKLGEAVPVPPFATGTKPVSEILGVVPPEDARGPEAVTLVTVPPEPVALIVWSGQGPVIVTPGPAISVGMVVPVPPSITGRGICSEILGLVPPLEMIGSVAVTAVTPVPEPPEGIPGKNGKYACKPPVNGLVGMSAPVKGGHTLGARASEISASSDREYPPWEHLD
jgi:hypothetical protein